jgi:hypothetical protein
VVLGLELRPYTLSHSIALLFFVKDVFKLFAQAGFKPRSYLLSSSDYRHEPLGPGHLVSFLIEKKNLIISF